MVRYQSKIILRVIRKQIWKFNVFNFLPCLSCLAYDLPAASALLTAPAPFVPTTATATEPTAYVTHLDLEYASPFTISF